MDQSKGQEGRARLKKGEGPNENHIQEGRKQNKENSRRKGAVGKEKMAQSEELVEGEGK